MSTSCGPIDLHDVRCPGGRTRPAEMVGKPQHELYLVRSGCFSYRTSGADLLADPTTCLMGGPHHLADIGHPVRGGDTGTAVFLSAELVVAVTGNDDLPPYSFTTPQLRIAHRRLHRTWVSGHDPAEIEEAGVALLAAALVPVAPARVATGPPGTHRRARLCREARAVLVADPALSSILDLALLLHCSPHHLSRVFREQTGQTFSGYRRSLRLAQAVERILDEDQPLAQVAADFGFADHAHLTRTLRRLHNVTPSQLRHIAKRT